VYRNDKVIRNLLVRSEDGQSWLAVIGTPLCKLRPGREEQSLLDDLLADPCGTIRNRIDGNFAVTAYDAVNERLIVAADMNNTTPVFYAVTPQGVLLCSHELALARHIGAGIDSWGFAQTIQLGVTWQSGTRFTNIRRTVPCEVAVFSTAMDVRTQPYWRPQDESIWTGHLDAQVERWLALLGEAVWRYYECAEHKPVVADFTAGEDARLLLAQCHKLGIPFTAQVTGLPDEVDVVVAKRASRIAGFELSVRPKRQISESELAATAQDIARENDGYLDFYKACCDFATDTAAPLDDYGVVKYGGVPGGEAFRGAYYLRGKAFHPTRRTTLDSVFFTRMKYLLDFHPRILRGRSEELLSWVYQAAKDALQEVDGFPIGTQIDHLLRAFQTSCMGLMYRNPLYLPLATSALTRSIYGISPRYKKGGRLTKACTEVLYPELARVRTQNRIPTIRRTILRSPLFWPEYAATLRHISSGAMGRLLKWTETTKWYYGSDWNAPVVNTLVNRPPYARWFASADSMMTGHLYTASEVNALLAEARHGRCRYLPLLGRVLGQELAMRWVHREVPS